VRRIYQHQPGDFLTVVERIPKHVDRAEGVAHQHVGRREAGHVQQRAQFGHDLRTGAGERGGRGVARTIAGAVEGAGRGEGRHQRQGARPGQRRPAQAGVEDRRGRALPGAIQAQQIAADVDALRRGESCECDHAALLHLRLTDHSSLSTIVLWYPQLFGHELHKFQRIENEDSCPFVKIRVIRDGG
jgi:hypothetical protein